MDPLDRLLTKHSCCWIDLEHAVRILEGFEHHAEKGVGAFNLDGKMFVSIMHMYVYIQTNTFIA